ncbi:MAG: NAD(P)-dependent oxidoreductase, partial [Chitinophagaceae bacterium]
MDKNPLFPVFIKLETLNVLVVGGGFVALEKLTAMLQNSPLTAIKLVACSISEEIKQLAEIHPTLQ